MAKNQLCSVGVLVEDALGVSVTTLLDYEHGPKVRVVPAERAVRLWHTEAGSYNRLLAGTEAPGPLASGLNPRNEASCGRPVDPVNYEVRLVDEHARPRCS